MLIYLSGGFENGSELNTISDVFPTNLRVLSPCLPGRGGSSRLRKINTFTNLAREVNNWLEALDVKEQTIYLWGTSFGSAIANEMFKIIKRPVAKIVLLTPGEFFAESSIKELGRKLFKNAYKHPDLLRSIKKLLHNFYPFNNDRFFTTDDRSLSEQWLSTLDYKVDTEFKTEIPALIINAKDDWVIVPESKQKILQVYKNARSIELAHQHVIDPYLETEYFKDLVRNTVLPFILD